MQTQTENVIDLYADLDALVKDYFAKTEASEDCPPLDMDWDFYIQMEHEDKLVLVTVRDDELLVGFVMYIIAPHPHHKGLNSAICDILATRLDRRRHGIGTHLVHAAEQYFKQHGKIDMMFHGFRTVYKTKPLFPRLGFKLVEQAFMKRL